jgi:hypothetical protein
MLTKDSIPFPAADATVLISFSPLPAISISSSLLSRKSQVAKYSALLSVKKKSYVEA